MKFLSILILFSFPFLLHAQTAQVVGKIADQDSKIGIELATIILKNLTDTTIIFGGKSNEDGQFVLKNVPFGNYIMRITSIGYLSKEIKKVSIDSENKNLKSILIKSNNKSLGNVNVVGEKATIQLSMDKKTFNVDKNITSAGGTAEDVLKNTPSVTVDLDGNVSMRGKDNVTIFVDGKPSAMFGNDPQTALQSIPAASIESIEVITNPSSKYDAQGMSGILNIVLKKDKKPGYNGMVSLGIAEPYKLNGGINFNANVKKWNVFVNANARTGRAWEKTFNDRDNYEDEYTYSSYAYNKRRPRSGFANFGFDYQINDRNKITLSQNIFNAKMKGSSVTTINNQYDFNELVNRQIRNNDYVGNPLSLTTNLQYKHNFKKPKEELTAEINFGKMRYLRESKFKTTLFDSNESYVSSYLQEIPIEGRNTNTTIQIDYTRPILKAGRFDLGAKNYMIHFKSENQPIRKNESDPWQTEPVLKNHFVFDQQIYAAYANVANQYKNTGIQLGLRAEYFNYSGTIYQYNSSVADNYISLFPTAFITQKIDDKQDLNLNYSRRVNRPDFRQLIPYIDVSNPQDTTQGNPSLKPEFIHATELAYNLKYGKSNNLIASVYYQYTNNLIQRYRRFNGDGTTYSQNRNLATGVTYGFELINKANLSKEIDVTATLNLFRNKINGANVDSTLTRSGYGGFAKLISNYKISKNWSAQIAANYYAQTVISQGIIEPYGNVDVAIKKNFYNNLATLTLNVNDVFNTIQTTTNYNLFPLYNQTVVRKNQTRSIGLNLQVKFASKSSRKKSASKPMEPMKKTNSKGKDKETKSRDENLKKDDGDGEEGGGGNR